MVELEAKRAEFARNVWNHSEDPFQVQFDERPPLAPHEIEAITRIVKAALRQSGEQAATELRTEFKRDISLLATTLQLVGLTRNKILQDLKAAQRSGVFSARVPSSYKALPKSDAWSVAAPYLILRLRKVFFSLKQQDDDAIKDAVEVVNQATWPGYIRQERAKRQGHEAEFRLAALHLACELEFEPAEKAENPLCRDALLGEVSFDLVVPNIRDPKVVVKSTVHTSNIGQYGESKDHLEVDEARRYLDEAYDPKSRPTLLAFIDGVGFESNRAGLNGVLEKADEFCQFKTIWKSIYITAQVEKRPFKFALPKSSIRDHGPFLHRWKGPATVMEREGFVETGDEIEAGEAWIATS